MNARCYTIIEGGIVMMPIMSPPAISLDILVKHAKLVGRPHVNYFKAVEAIWVAGTLTGVDPVVMSAQCAKETNWWNFGGRIDSSWANTAGMKIRNPVNNDDRPENHARFPLGLDNRPHASAMAQAHQLMCYAGRDVPIDTPSHRAVWVTRGSSRFGSALYVEQLGGKWAPAADYGTSVVTIAQRLIRGN